MDNFYVGINSSIITVDLKQSGEFPFEKLYTTIFINPIYLTSPNLTIQPLSPTSEIKYIYAWGQALEFTTDIEGNKIEINLERINKPETIKLYFAGLSIISIYIILFFCFFVVPTIKHMIGIPLSLNDEKNLNKLDLFTAYNYLGFLFFVTIVISGVREYLSTSIWAKFFIVLIFIFIIFTLVVALRKTSLNEQENETLEKAFQNGLDKIKLIVKQEKTIEELKKENDTLTKQIQYFDKELDTKS